MDRAKGLLSKYFNKETYLPAGGTLALASVYLSTFATGSFHSDPAANSLWTAFVVAATAFNAYRWGKAVNANNAANDAPKPSVA